MQISCKVKKSRAHHYIRHTVGTVAFSVQNSYKLTKFLNQQEVSRNRETHQIDVETMKHLISDYKILTKK